MFYTNSNNIEQEACKTAEGLFRRFNKKFRPQHNEIILSFQYCKLNRQSVQTEEEWIERLSIKATDWKYKEIDRHLKELFICDTLGIQGFLRFSGELVSFVELGQPDLIQVL